MGPRCFKQMFYPELQNQSSIHDYFIIKKKKKKKKKIIELTPSLSILILRLKEVTGIIPDSAPRQRCTNVEKLSAKIPPSALLLRSGNGYDSHLRYTTV